MYTYVYVFVRGLPNQGAVAAVAPQGAYAADEAFTRRPLYVYVDVYVYVYVYV